ncbi:hypothetical protein [Pseudanabaena mucicola]|uniref:Recombinase family protein n=1 Tax=Pseudanabaena mucicola FACHB-723 TaxID=2692860 RepID=A0ABR7ZUG7_9CYAN|nr:hypothetical protein [Pseudanabaena mucicola]MBD2187548.1 hypothetical protein [Pseudanabaena mucicola FACHB-723]
MANLWIEGGTHSGKTEQIVQQFCDWAEMDFAHQFNPQAASQRVLVFAVDAQQRRNLSNRLMLATHGKYPITSVTPISFCQNEVRLFWTLLVNKLDFKAQFPLSLRIENEQELAAKLWKDRLDSGTLQMEGIGRERLVRRLLDLFLLSAYAGRDILEIPAILNAGIEINPIDSTDPNLVGSSSDQWQEIGEALQEWRAYCWEKGLLTYGIITDLFTHHLQPHPTYQRKLKQRYRYVIVDRADEMPAITCDLCKFLLAHDAQGLFTFNPDGAARLGLGADPEYWQEIKTECKVVSLPKATDTLGAQIAQSVLEVVSEPILQWKEPYDSVHSIESVSRAKLFRNVAETIESAIANDIKANEIAIIAPGLDNIAQYAIAEILRKKNINITPLNDQRPLSYSAKVRSLITLLTLVYPNLGQLVSRDHIAEMLVVLTDAIDPVRAGMLADYCFVRHPENPQLLEAETYNQWNRLGYEATQAYEQLRQWLKDQSPKDAPLLCIDRAIQHFFKPRKLSYEHTSTLQSLIETAQHYWQLGYRLDPHLERDESMILENFIQLIRQGTVAANPYAPNLPEDSVVLATIFQYRMARLSHRWQFWLDASSELWLQGGSAALFAAPLFLKNWHGGLWTIENQRDVDMQRLQRLLRDLLDRTQEQIYLCHSELNTNGQLQNGVLLPLIEISATA